MKQLLVIEAGDELLPFVEHFFADELAIRSCRSGREALERLTTQPVDAFLLDLRFERSPEEELLGDLAGIAERRFAGSRERACAYLREHQGTFVLAALREAGHDGPAVFVHDFTPRQLSNLRRLYGRVEAVPSFDARRIEAALGLTRRDRFDEP
jgi:hypothetical protein